MRLPNVPLVTRATPIHQMSIAVTRRALPVPGTRSAGLMAMVLLTWPGILTPMRACLVARFTLLVTQPLVGGAHARTDGACGAPCTRFCMTDLVEGHGAILKSVYEPAEERMNPTVGSEEELVRARW